VDLASAAWMKNQKIDGSRWSTQEWLHFLSSLPKTLSAANMRRLDGQWHFTETGNDEILAQWLLMAVRNRYEPAYPTLETFLETVGRRKYVKPLYDALDRKHAIEIYDKARPMYHPITQTTIDDLLASKK